MGELMPTHIDVQAGDYRRSIDSNTAAVNADEKYLSKAGAKNFYSVYRFHNYHSFNYAAMLCGQRRTVLEATDRMKPSITDELLLIESRPLVDWMEFFQGCPCPRLHSF